MTYSTVVWLPNALVLTALLAAVAVWRWRHGGALSGLRWTGVAMLPLALYAVGLWRLLWNVGLALWHFLTGFAFHPSVWAGLILLVVALALIVVPGRLGGREERRPTDTAPSRQQLSRRKASDDDFSDIEDILKKHGIG